MTKNPPHRGGCRYIVVMTEIKKRRGPGRPALPDDERADRRTIRLTEARWEKLKRLGMAWLNRTIDRAKEPDKE